MAALDFNKAFGSGGLTVNYTPPPPKPKVVVPNGISNSYGYGTINRGGGGGVAAPSQPAPQPNVKSAYDLAYESAASSYDSIRDDLNSRLGDLGRQKDSLLDQIGATYRGLTQSAKDTLEKNLGVLGGRQTDVETQYEASRQNVGRSLIDRQRQQRMAARATGVLPSSFYLNQQNEAGREATENISGLNTEERSKLDAIGTAITNAKTDTNTKIQALAEEEASSKRDVVNRYLAQEDMIRNSLSANSRDKMIALSQNRNALAGALEQLSYAFGSIGQNVVSSANTFRQGLADFNPLSAISSTLDTRNALSGAEDFSTVDLPVASSPTGGPTLNYYYNPRKRESYLDGLTF